MSRATFRFYEELNDFLPLDLRKTEVPYAFVISPSVKDAIESLGVPHVEVELIVVKGESVGFDYRLSDGDRIAVEAKNQAQLNLTGRDGILAELDRAMANREAAVAVCISGRDAFPGEVGTFGVYGDRILAVDDGDGTMTAVALRWALASMARRRNDPGATVDVAALGEHLDRIRTLADRFRTTRRSLTDIGKSVDSVRDALAAMRTDLLDLVDEMQRTVSATSSP